MCNIYTFIPILPSGFVLGFDIHNMGVQAGNNELYDAAAAFLQLLVKQTGTEEKFVRFIIVPCGISKLTLKEQKPLQNVPTGFMMRN